MHAFDTCGSSIAAMSRPKRKPAPRRTMPTCPLGQLIYDASVHLDLNYSEVIQLVNAAGEKDGVRNVNFNRTSLARWLTGTIPHTRTQRWIASALDIPAARLAEAAHAQEAQQRSATMTAGENETPPTLRDPVFSNVSLDGPADQGFVELIHRSIQQLVLLDNHFGADDIAGIAVRLFRAVTHRLATGLYQPTVERDLMAAAGETGELAGWLLFDADQ